MPPTGLSISVSRVVPIAMSSSVVSDAGAAIEARATDARNAAVTAFSLVVFPTSRDLWFPDSRHLKASLSGQIGSARVTGLPPGDYYVAAVNRFQLFPSGGELSDPDVLEQLSREAEPITLKEREHRTLTLRLTRRPDSQP